MIDRKQLDKIILKNDVKDWWIPELFVKNTKPIFPPELEVLADPPEEAKITTVLLTHSGSQTG